MPLLLLIGFAEDAPATSCSFEVSVDGQDFVAATPVQFAPMPTPHTILVEDSASSVVVRADSGTTIHWPLVGEFELQAPGTLVATNAPAEFAPPVGGTLVGLSGIVMAVHFSRVQDAEGAATFLLSLPPPGRDKADPIPTTWRFQPRRRNLVRDPPLSGGKLATELADIDPGDRSYILERRSGGPPLALAVHVPEAVDLATADRNYLVFFHASMAQSYPTYYSGAYPWSYDYVYSGLWYYLNYDRDPLTEYVYSLGLAYQVTASARPVVLVLPMSHSHDEIGSFANASDMALTLAEVDRYVARRAGNYTGGNLGRLGIAGFSSGCAYVAAFPSVNANHPLVTTNLAELYAFDPPGWAVPHLAASAGAWAAGDHERRVRIYHQGAPPEFGTLLGGAALPAGPGIAQSADGHHSLGVVPLATWAAAAQAAKPGTTVGTGADAYWHAHHLMPAMLLLDAIRRSGY